MAVESSYETLCLVMMATAMILGLVYEEEHRLTLKGLGHDSRSKILFLFFMYKMVYWCILND